MDAKVIAGGQSLVPMLNLRMVSAERLIDISSIPGLTEWSADERAAFMEDLDRYDQRSQIVGFNKTLEMYPEDPWSREGLAACNISLGKPKEATDGGLQDLFDE